MNRPAFYDNLASEIILDTSVVINLNASGFGHQILSSIPNQFYVSNIAASELLDRAGARPDGSQLAHLISNGLIKLFVETEDVYEVFGDLVAGDAQSTLDDGEAATIASAVDRGFVVILDERKANRICREKFGHLSVASSVDLFRHSAVIAHLGANLPSAILAALKFANMRVADEHLNWVVGQIGCQFAASCKSLPAKARSPDFMSA
jgi:predicted nucleic acid-binding protein